MSVTGTTPGSFDPGDVQQYLRNIVPQLSQISANNYETLTEVRSFLASGTQAQSQFIQAGGATVLTQLLQHESAMIQKKALKAILLLAQPLHATALLEYGAVETLLQVFFNFKKQSRRKQLCGEVLKSLAGCHTTPEDSARSVGGATPKDNRFWSAPVWIRQESGSGSEPVWDQEAVSCLVDGVLMAEGAPLATKKTAERAIIKLLAMSPHTRKVIVDKQLMDEIVTAIRGQSSCAEALMKVVTCLTLMHASNEVTFVRCGGLESLVEAARSDSSGSVGGEMATWCLLHFVDAKEEHAVRAVLLGAVEALTQQLYSPEVTCRHAAAATLFSLLSRDDKTGAVKARVVEANGVPALLSALQDTHPRLHQAAATKLILKILHELITIPAYKEEIDRAGGQEMIQEATRSEDWEVSQLASKLSKKLGRTSIKDKIRSMSFWPKAKGKSKFTADSFSSNQDPVKFDFDLEYYNIQTYEADVASRANSKFSDRVKSMFRRPASVSGGSVRGFPVNKSVKNRAASERGGSRRRPPGRLNDDDNRSQAGSDAGGSVASFASTTYSMSAAGRKQLAKLNAKDGPVSAEEDPFTPLRSKYSASGTGPAGATTGTSGPPAVMNGASSGLPPLRSTQVASTLTSINSRANSLDRVSGRNHGPPPLPYKGG